MSSRTQLLALAALFLSFDTGQAQGLVEAAQPDAPKATVVKLTLHPSATPVPALKYHLLPEVEELRPGNAALLYQRAHNLESWSSFVRAGEIEKMSELLELPLRKTPKEKIVLIPWALKEIDLAARREYCDWEMTPRLREEGFSLLIPDVQGFRTFGVMLALRARLDILDGKFDKAVDDMQTGFALGRHVGDAPILINSLVGIAITQIMLGQVEDFVQQEKAPSLYWALADLPRPFIDLRRALQGEKVGINGMLAEIRAALKKPNHPPIPQATLNSYSQMMQSIGVFSGEASANNRLMFTLIMARAYPAAKQFLLDRGFPEDRIAAMPITQVALMYSLSLYDEAYDDTYKWQSFPYWEARDGLAKARKQFDHRMQDQREASFLARLTLPALDHVMFAKARLDRRIAMLQIVEALRLTEATDGKLPDRLEDIRAVPIPIDPVTGKAFEYTREANRAILYGPPPTGEIAHEGNALRYEITLVSKK